MTAGAARAGSIRRRGARRAAGAAALAALVPAVAFAGDAPRDACVRLTDVRDARLGAWTVAVGDGIRLRYVHSVTRTPVEERYVVTGGTLRQVEIRFAEHGPGLPTEADAGASWSREDGRFVVRLSRDFEMIAACVDAAQSPRLDVAGATVDLAPGAPRAIRIRAEPGRCDA